MGAILPTRYCHGRKAYEGKNVSKGQKATESIPVGYDVGGGCDGQEWTRVVSIVKESN